VGKSTVVRRLLHGLDHRHAVWCVQLSATQLETGELAGSLARAFGAPAGAASRGQLHAELRRHLATLGRGRTVLAVVDDAHALPPEALTELGELVHEGPLRVLLVGRPALRMLLQRQLPLHPASLECHLDPLLDSETPAYVDHRLRRVAPEGAPPFSDEAKALTHRFSRACRNASTGCASGCCARRGSAACARSARTRCSASRARGWTRRRSRC
jgi:type II secretory pathway predicted ATPase ExeA